MLILTYFGKKVEAYTIKTKEAIKKVNILSKIQEETNL